MNTHPKMTTCCPSCDSINEFYLYEMMVYKMLCHNCKKSIFLDNNEEFLDFCLFEFRRYLNYVRPVFRQYGFNKETIKLLYPDTINIIFTQHVLLAQNYLLCFYESDPASFYGSDPAIKNLKIGDLILEINSLLDKSLYINYEAILKINIPYLQLEKVVNQNFVDVEVENNNLKKMAQGAAIGALAGSCIPIVGTLLGGIIGGVAVGASTAKHKYYDVGIMEQSLIDAISTYCSTIYAYFIDNLKDPVIDFFNSIEREDKFCTPQEPRS